MKSAPRKKLRTAKQPNFIKKARPSKEKTKSPSKKSLNPVHPWRSCPYGEHWVRSHPLHVPPGRQYPEGHETIRHGHCARNPSGKDQLYPEEIHEIASQKFSKLENRPCALDLDFKNGTAYDDFIAGWVQYWNEVLSPDELLEPNLVKALIASESGFRPTKLANEKDSDGARGLTQITNETRNLLGGDRGDLKDHLITLTKEELNDPNLNICAGVRWLFEKRRLVSAHLKRPASWIETVWDYKGVKLAKTKKKAKGIKNIFNQFYERLQKCTKK